MAGARLVDKTLAIGIDVGIDVDLLDVLPTDGARDHVGTVSV